MDQFFDWLANGARIPFGQWVNWFIREVVIQYLGWLFDFFAMIFTAVYEGLETAFTWPPFWVIVIVFAALGWYLKGWTFGLGTAAAFLLIFTVNQWNNAMQTLALTVLAATIAILIAIPLGIWTARSSRASAIARPVLDFLQTMPAFVYLIPAIMLFSVGVVPGIFATILFSLAPGVRLTELGIRGVDNEVVEAGNAFGATPGRILRQIQLPLAMPSIMAGVNQVIMLSLSMTVIASMVGAPGLGVPIIASLTRINIGLGFEAGLSVVLIAIILDRLTGSLGTRGRATAPAAA